MANVVTRNMPSPPIGTSRPIDAKRTTHSYFQEFSVTDLGTTAVHLNAYIKAQAGVQKLLNSRTHVEITNTHATAKIYVKRWVPGGVEATTGIYQWLISPVGGYLKIPMDADMDLSIISDTASTTTALICELG